MTHKTNCPACAQNTVEAVTGTEKRICTMCGHQWTPAPKTGLRTAYQECYRQICAQEAYGGGMTAESVIELRNTYGDFAFWSAMQSAATRYDWPDITPTRLRYAHKLQPGDIPF